MLKYKIPQIVTLTHVDPSIPLILLTLGKEKSPNFFKIQGFTSFYLLKKWCHQESNLLIRLILIP